MLMQLPLASSESNVKSDVRWDHTGRRLEGYTGPADAVPHKQQGGTTQRAFVPSFRSFVCFLNNHGTQPVPPRETRAYARQFANA